MARLVATANGETNKITLIVTDDEGKVTEFVIGLAPIAELVINGLKQGMVVAFTEPGEQQLFDIS